MNDELQLEIVARDEASQVIDKIYNSISKLDNSYSKLGSHKRTDKVTKDMDNFRKSILNTKKEIDNLYKEMSKNPNMKLKMNIGNMIAKLEADMNQAGKFGNFISGNDDLRQAQGLYNEITSVARALVGENDKYVSSLDKNIARLQKENDLLEKQAEKIKAKANYVPFKSRELISQLNSTSSLTSAATQPNDTALATLRGTINDVINKFKVAKQTAKDFGNEGAKSIHRISSVSSTLTGKLVRLRILTSAVKSTIMGISKVYDMAASYEEALNLYTVSLGQYANEGRKWADMISEKLYLDPTNILQYTGAFKNLVEGLGVGEEHAFKMARNLTQLSYDMSSYLNIDVESAQAKIQSAITGQSRAVASAGIAMQQASLQELAYSMGIRKSVSEMTQSEKTYLRYIQLLDKTKKMQGDLARTIVTPENALRMLKTQFTLLARAIGQVLVPIIMKAIPYIMAFTRMLTNMAKMLSGKLGFKIQEIDYSSLTTADMALEEFSDKAKGTASSVKDSVSRTLAAFDDLNVVESENKGGSAGGIGGFGDDNITDKLKEYVDGYDMLEGLTKQLEEQSLAAEKALKEGLLPALLKIVAGLTLLKLPKIIRYFKTWKATIDSLKNMKVVQGLIEGLKGATSGLTGTFMAAFNASKAFGNNGLVAAYDGIKALTNNLSPLTKALGLVTIGFTTFSTTSTTAYDYFVGKTEMGVAETIKFTGSITALSAAAGLLIGPGGPLVVLASMILGTAVAAQRAKEDMAWKAGYDTLFDGVGRSLTNLKTTLDNNFGIYDNFNKQNDELRNNIDRASGAVDNAKNNVKLLSEELASQDTSATKEQIDSLRKAYEDLKSALQQQIDAEKEQELARIDQLHELAKTSQEDYEKQKKAAIDAYTTEKLLTSEYADKLAELEIRKTQGLIKDKEYEEQLQKLKSEYYGVSGELDTVSNNLQSYINIQSAKWDLSNFDGSKKGAEGVAEGIQQIIDKTNEYKEQEDKRYEATKKDIEADQLNTETRLKNLERLKNSGQELSKSQQDMYDTLSDKLKVLNQDFSDNETAHKNQIGAIEGTLKSFLLSVGSQIDTATDTFDITNRNLSTVLKTIETGLQSVKDADTKSAVEQMYQNMDKNIDEEGKTYSKKWTMTIGKYGETTANGYVNSYVSALESVNNMKRHESAHVQPQLDAIRNTEQQLLDKANATGKNVGTNMAEGIGDGVKEGMNSSYVYTNTDKGMNLYDAHIKDYWDTHSPSKKTRDEVGVFLAQGIADGILKGATDNYTTSKIKSAMEGLKNGIESNIKSIDTTLKINTNVETSFNTILSKLQTFCNKWKDAINSMLSKTKTSMNSINVDKSGKITYTSMPTITIPKFAQGGYPSQGDLFLANEAGPEFVGTIGNKTAVANQDQLVTALTNAIVNGINKMNVGTSQTPQHVDVYIGNEKVYSGQAKYQNRQSDRFGTNVINV